MAETPEMESPLARQDCFVEAQEDSTSVEVEAEGTPSPGMISTTITTTTTDAGDNDYATYPSVVRDSCEDLVVERLDEESEARQSSDKPEASQGEEEKEEKELNMGLTIGKKVNEKNEKDEIDAKSTEDTLQELEGSPRMPDSQNRDIDESSELWENGIEESMSSDVSRKRPAASDFMPIGAEIKRIGIEISEEQATQLRNDVRRLSPVLVSLRERTLGEVSLTSESCLFGDELDGRITPRSPARSFMVNNSRNQDVDQNRGKQDVNEENKVEKETIGRISSDPLECTSSGDVEVTINGANRKINYESEGEITTFGVDVDSSIFSKSDNLDGTTESCQDEDANMSTNARSESCTTIKKHVKATMSSEVPSSPLCRNLSIVLNRIENEDSKKREESAAIDTNVDENIWNYVVEENSPYSDGKKNFIEEEHDSFKSTSGTPDKNSKKQRWQSPTNNSSPITRSKKYELIESARSPDSELTLKKCKVVLERINKATGHSSQSENTEESESGASRELEKNDESAPVAVIGKLEENEEVVLASSSPTAEDSRVSNELDSSETMPSSPEETPEVSVDVAEGVDTETETETGSDSSEVSPITSIRHELRDADMAPDQLPCSEGVTLCCVEAIAPIMTRLEADRPEAYTEDSAESLALATGARDEVRSDGSDSGLGNEIPGDPGPAPAPESDSETSFLDRLPDDILSDKEKGVNQLDGYAASSGTPGTPGQLPLTNFRTLPAKSNLKRRLTDCMEGDESRGNVDEPLKKKRNIQFDAVTVYYFPRAQGFTCVPSQGGSTLGMSATHTHAERFSLSEHAAEQRRIHRARLAQLRSERNCATNCVTETASSSEDPSDDTDEEPSDNEELDIDSYYFLQPVPTWQRRALLRAAGVRRIDAVEKDECRDIRASREHCGCGCKGYCDPESCPCSRANVKCQVDRPGFPCGCTRDGCANSTGRIEFNPVRVRTHFIHTLMRLELEKKQRDEDGGGDHDQVMDNQGQNGRGARPLRNIGSLGMEATVGDVCAIPGTGPGGGGFTTLHYETSHEGVGAGVAGCQPEVPGTREDSLDLYAIRDDCYASEDAVDSSQSVVVQRKLHPEFGQAFQSFSPGVQNSATGGGGGGGGGGGSGSGMSFQQSSYQDYGSPYASLPSTSRFQPPPPQFQSPPNPAAFAHYGPYGGPQDAASTALQGGCTGQVHQMPQPPPPQGQQQQQQQHSSYDATVFAQDDATGTAQYTNLTNSVQPMNATVVQQMQGKLEPFSELLSGRYSYYGEMHEPQQHHGTYGTHGTAGKVAEMIEPSQVSSEQQPDGASEDCDENFGEIIKKSMVETVSA
ncbi:PREDICTED: uncharacterized protein LOC108782266 [Cyphomyrmex costatus]|nr:PREDICTED: uncharacterized protein LOC108782266 [Cyphomyrmex costatus]XP_018405988.1 PREDICTED: uncharacterized protein LOC108782266 [Cyphomyrmex costatus]XP_018405990.1 PREDICTED: uncharacterized protein LOC108782266 [Cyphomyrmex costatus]